MLKKHGKITSVKSYTPKIDINKSINRFSGIVVITQRKTIGFKVKFLINEKHGGLKCKIIELQKNKSDSLSLKYQYILTLRIYGDKIINTQREKLQIAFKMKNRLFKDVNIDVKKIQPPTIKYRWQSSIFDLNTFHENSSKIIDQFMNFNFSDIPGPTEQLL